MQQTNVKNMVVAALFAALVCIATVLFVIPLPGNGFANLGDCVVITAGCLLGPVWGGLAAAIGAALADLFLGYVIYVPATFAIKGFMAVCAYLLIDMYRRSANLPSIPHIALAAVAAEAVMVLGYFIFEFFLLGIAVAAADTLGNFIQGAIGVITATALLRLLLHNKTVSSYITREK